MDIFEAARVLMRWWFVALPLTVLTLVGAVVSTSQFAPEYTSGASILFVGPTVVENDIGELEPVNPLLSQSSSLVSAAVVTSLTLSNPQVVGILADEGLSTSYEVGTESRTPILLLQVRGDSREIVLATALRLSELVESDVKLRQDAAEVPDHLRVTTSLLGLSAVGGADYSSRTRALLALVAVGFGVTGAVVFMLEGYRRRREAQPPNTL